MTTFLAIVVAILTSILVYIEVKTHRFITQSYKGACLALNHADKGPNPAESKAYLIGIADAYLNMARFWGFELEPCLVTDKRNLLSYQQDRTLQGEQHHATD
jgi:predicted DNA-binding WGR domain protein